MLILEAGINHFGKSKEAEKFLDFFLSSKFTHLSFMIQTTQFYKNFENKINFKLTNSFYKKAILLAHKKKKKIGLAVCDPISFGEVSNINFDFYKLLSISINDKLLINALNNKRKDVYISLGKGNNKDISKCINSFSNKKKLKLVYTSMSYNPKDINLKRIEELKKKFNLEVGYGDHYSNNVAIILSNFYEPSFHFVYIKKSPKNSKRIFPDHEHAYELNYLNYLDNTLEEAKLILQKRKTNFNIKINEIKKIKY